LQILPKNDKIFLSDIAFTDNRRKI